LKRRNVGICLIESNALTLLPRNFSECFSSFSDFLALLKFAFKKARVSFL
jgi:hypothetical protein